MLETAQPGRPPNASPPRPSSRRTSPRRGASPARSHQLCDDPSSVSVTLCVTRAPNCGNTYGKTTQAAHGNTPAPIGRRSATGHHHAQPSHPPHTGFPSHRPCSRERSRRRAADRLAADHGPRTSSSRPSRRRPRSPTRREQHRRATSASTAPRCTRWSEGRTSCTQGCRSGRRRPRPQGQFGRRNRLFAGSASGTVCR